MSETNYKIRFKKGDLEIEVQGDREFVLSKFEELMKSKITSERTAEIEKVKGLPTSLAEYVKIKGSPKGHTDLTVMFAYWLFKKENMERFNAKDIENCYSLARIPKPANISDIMNKNQRKGFLMRSGKKYEKIAWSITRSGEEYVERMGKET